MSYPTLWIVTERLPRRFGRFSWEVRKYAVVAEAAVAAISIVKREFGASDGEYSADDTGDLSCRIRLARQS